MQATTTAATVSLAKWAASPRIRSDFESGMDITWSDNTYTRAGQIPPFAEVGPRRYCLPRHVIYRTTDPRFSW